MGKMHTHFLSTDNTENRIRYTIFRIMVCFEKMHESLNAILDFSISEKEGLACFREQMKELLRLDRVLMEEYEVVLNWPDEDCMLFEVCSIYEGLRRTHNLLKEFRKIRLDRPDWIILMSRALIDSSYYRQIKALVY